MNPDSVKQFQAALEARLKELELETGHVDGGPNSIGDTLRVLLPVTDDGDMVLTEFTSTLFDPLLTFVAIVTTLFPFAFCK